MRIFGTRLHASNDAIVKLWAGAAIVILAVAAILTWSDRFRESFETSLARISVFGVETSHGEAANFTGSRGFFAKMNKLGMPPSARKAELAALFDELKTTGALGEIDARDVPVLWIYAEGLTKEDRDNGVRTFGKIFFEEKHFCLSVADGNGFSVQLDPGTFRVLWAKDGGAICAIPLLLLPPDAGARGFVFKTEERGENGAWILRGETKIPPSADFYAEANERANAEISAAETPSAENPDAEFFPQSLEAESLTLPRICRFFSERPDLRSAFGDLRLRVAGNASGKVPAAAWSLKNFGIFETDGAQSFPCSRADAFHKNVRFLESEIFENSEAGSLRVPVAKTLFPRADGSANAPWTLDLVFVRRTYFPEDFFAVAGMRIGKNASVLANAKTTKNSTAKIRAFRDTEYFRTTGGRPAVVLEIENGERAADFFWEPYRVKTESGEELFPESVVEISPTVRQFWFLPREKSPEKLDVIFAVTKMFRTRTEVVPEVVPAE